jgi:hypothetical protein
VPEQPCLIVDPWSCAIPRRHADDCRHFGACRYVGAAAAEEEVAAARRFGMEVIGEVGVRRRT